MDPVVTAMQDAGTEWSEFYDRVEGADGASRLVRAIRCRNKRLVESLLGPDCQVICFFERGRYACVRIGSSFGSCCDVRITQDICVSQASCRNR